MRPEIARLIEKLGQPVAQSSDYDLNPGLILPADRILRPAAVLVAFWPRKEGLQLVLTKRASHLKHHPGQIAFPGGKLDPEDSGPEAAALREAHEEIGLAPSSVEILGRLPSHETVTGFTVYPILGHIRADFTPVPEAGEVDEIFQVPLDHVLNTANFTIERRLWRGQWRHFYIVPYGPYYIWGATARILYSLARQVET